MEKQFPQPLLDHLARFIEIASQPGREPIKTPQGAAEK